MTARETLADWWRDAVVYQVYPRSFADSDADGIGDLAGLRSRLPYLAGLGIDAIWLSPFYPSPLADGGYDVVDHRDVDERLGTLAEFDALVADAHERDIRVVVDIVANHTSDRHPWFLAAQAAAPGHPDRERYIFRDGLGPDGDEPPADWRSHFGGGAWERVGDGQWYCHLFTREQPDLDWGNEEVQQYFLDTLRFWSDRGVDGFRVDVAHSLAKDLRPPLRSQPHLDLLLPTDGSDPLYDRDEVHTIYEAWRRVFDEYDPPRMAVAETWHPTNHRNYLYARPTELGQVFDFSFMKCRWDRDQMTDTIRQALAHHDGAGGPTWVLSSHDTPRHASRLDLPADVTIDDWLCSDGQNPAIRPDVGRRRARAATMLMLALPGSAYLYQGEELGLLEVADLPVDALHDPTWQRTGGRSKGRDGCRVPLPWTRSGASFGFGEGGSWLPQPPWFGDCAVDAQDGVEGSCLSMYRAALALRRSLLAAAAPHGDGGVEWCALDDPALLHLRRGAWTCITNFSTESRLLPPGRVLLSSGPCPPGAVAGETTAWMTDVPHG